MFPVAGVPAVAAAAVAFASTLAGFGAPPGATAPASGSPAVPSAGAEGTADGSPSVRAFRADTVALGTGPYARMGTLLERTIFQVNVAHLTLRYDSAAAARVRGLVAGREPGEAAADSVVAAVMGAARVHGRLAFRRDVGLDRFLRSLGESMRAARDAGLLAASAYADFRGRLPGWYAALEGRGVREGDVTEYRIRADTLRVIVRSAGGEVLVDRTDVGTAHRNAVLGGFLAPGSDFRDGLVGSLFGGGGDG